MILGSISVPVLTRYRIAFWSCGFRNHSTRVFWCCYSEAHVRIVASDTLRPPLCHRQAPTFPISRAPSIFAGAPSKLLKCQNCPYHLSSLKMPFLFRNSFLPPFSKSFLLVFHFFLRHCLWFVGVARLSTAVKVKFPTSSFVVVGGDKRGTQMVFVRRGRTDGFRIKLIRKFRINLIQSCGANEPHVDCSDAFKTSQVFECREDVLRWARSVAHENGFVAVILRSDTNTGSRGRSMFVLIGCERSGEYTCRKKEFIRRDTGTRKCGCPFKLRCKPVAGGEGWMMKLICGVHNHELAKSLVGHPYAGRLTKAEKTLIADMTKSMVKPRNIMLTLKEHNANSCTTIKQIYNARSAFRSSIRGSDLEMQHLMKLLERDQYIYWHRIKDEDVVRDIFWCHPDSVKLVNACNLVFLIDSTYKTNQYRLPLLDFVGMTPTGMTFSSGFAYVEGERVNNLVWALQRFRGLFLKRDVLPGVIVTDRDQTLMNAVKDVFPECTNLLCIFHINKNVKAKCKSLIAQKNAWDYVMDCWGSLTDCPSEQQFDECLKKFEVACAPWPIFVDYVKETWIIPHKEKFVSAWTNKVMHLGNKTTNRVESAHSSLKRLLQNSIGDLCSVWDAVNNMITLQHTQIKASFETSTHVVGHVFQKTLYRRLLGMVSRYALNQIAAKFERVHYAGKNPPSCGCVVRTTLGLPCACELSKYVGGCIPLDSIHMFWRRLSFSDQGLSEPEVGIKDVMETIYQKFEELDVCGKFTLRSKLWEIGHPDQNSMYPPQQRLTQRGHQRKLRVGTQGQQSAIHLTRSM
ncbi:PKS-NRPS hybrid synthetase [Glycine max]|nr:PKS-NRPS hybrid synthetase [Glycine max]